MAESHHFLYLSHRVRAGGADLPVTLHGTASLPRSGDHIIGYTRGEGDIRIVTGKESCVRATHQSGVLYVHAEEWCPRLRIFAQSGRSSVCGPCSIRPKSLWITPIPFLTFGVYHNTVFDRLSRLILKLGYRKAIIIQGSEGSDELFIHRPTRTYRVENGEASLHIIDPEAYGLDTPVPDISWTPSEQANVTLEVLQGKGISLLSTRYC